MARRQRRFLWIGLLLYSASFFLPALGASNSHPLSGWFCAGFSLVDPWRNDSKALLHERPFEYFSLLISGWINPLFVIAAIIGLLARRRQQLIAALKGIIIAMIPFCWVVYFDEHSYPREGHVLWIVGMVLALFADQFAQSGAIEDR